MPQFTQLANELIDASKSQDAFESWIDKRVSTLSVTDADSTWYKCIVDLKKRNVDDALANNINNKDSPFQKLLKLLKELEEEANEDSRNRILCDDKGGFVRGLSLMFVDPVVELALNDVSKC